MISTQVCLPLLLEETKPVEDGSSLFINGWLSRSMAEGRLSGTTCRHFLMKSRASLDKELGIGGGSPRPILKIACVCHIKRDIEFFSSAS